MSGTPKCNVGEKYGHLTILEDTGKRKKYGQVVWKCQCDCGNIVFRGQDSLYESLIGGYTISCGCKRSREIGQREKDNPVRKDKARKSLGQIDGTTMVGIGEQKLRKNNTSGVRGVGYDKQKKRWRARLMLRRSEISKYFDTKEQAIEYRKYLEQVYYDPIKQKFEEHEREEQNESDS